MDEAGSRWHLPDQGLSRYMISCALLKQLGTRARHGVRLLPRTQHATTAELCHRRLCHLQVDSVYHEFSGRTVIDLGCGTVRPEAPPPPRIRAMKDSLRRSASRQHPAAQSPLLARQPSSAVMCKEGRCSSASQVNELLFSSRRARWRSAPRCSARSTCWASKSTQRPWPPPRAT